MRALILSAVILGGIAGAAQAQDAPGYRGPLFISPMGEPFRGVDGGPPPQDMWFDGADANHDGALTVEEMVADGARFFATLDVRRDGEIDPQDVERYEGELVPEIWGSGPLPPRREGTTLTGNGDGPKQNSGGFGSPRKVASKTRIERKGAARFGYLDYPQPIISADRNFNRGVDVSEFTKAAEGRFELLDANGDGKIEKSELPELPHIRR